MFQGRFVAIYYLAEIPINIGRIQKRQPLRILHSREHALQIISIMQLPNILKFIRRKYKWNHHTDSGMETGRISKKAKSSDFLYQGNQLLKSSMVAEAEEAFQAAIEHNPESFDGYAGLAKIAMAHKNWHKALNYWNTCFEMQPDNYPVSWILNKANVCFALGAIDDANALFTEYSDKKPDKPWGYAGLAQIASTQGNWSTALNYLNKCFELRPKSPPGNWVLKKVDALLALKRLDDAEAYIAEYLQKHPEDVKGHIALARIASQRHLPKKELAIWERVANQFPDYLNGQIQYTRLLRYFERNQEAESILQSLSSKHPLSEVVLENLAWTARSAKDFEKAEQRFRKLTHKFPNNSKYKRLLIRSLTENTKYEEAQRYFDQHLKASGKKEDLILQVWLFREMLKVDEVLDSLDAFLVKHPRDEWGIELYIQFLRYLYRPTGDKKLLYQALDFIRRLKDRASNRDRNRIKEMEIYLMLEEPEEVITRYHLLEDKSSELALKWQAWKLNQDGNLEGAKAVWNQILNTFYIPQIQQPGQGVLRKVDTHPIVLKEDSIYVFTAVRNERWRLPWFLNYYRNLGVDRFFFVDNDSSDGTQQYLLEQKDVFVFHTHQSYSVSYSGMQWMNHLIEIYGSNAWCMYIDVDEALVFPDFEHKTLKDLARYMSVHNYEAMYAFMLDMESGDSPPSYSPDEQDSYMDFAEDYPFFENEYNWINSKYCPYFFTAGGSRRKFKVHENQTKTPLFRGGRGIKMLSSSHCITPARLADISGILLHYKMTGDAQKIFARDLKENNRAPHCRRRYWAYLQKGTQTLQGKDKTHTDRFTSSQQLIHLGLMNTSDQFKAFTND